MLERADHMNERRILVLTTHTGSVSFIDPNGPSLDGIAEVEDDPRDMVGRGKMGHRTVFISLASDGQAVMSPVLSSAKGQGISTCIGQVRRFGWQTSDRVT